VQLTEREIFDSGQEGLEILQELRAAGITVAIDDFGTGYSSLSYLNDLPVDAIKLDKSFLRNIPEVEQDRRVAGAIIALAHGLNLEVVAEGVETPEQASFFQAENCAMLQGFLFNPPLPPPR
jgi:EAL domain-containing protein (putative c-di-GMP-specific phosphodiesterase class I)